MKKRGKLSSSISIAVSSLILFLLMFLIRYDPPLNLFPTNETLFEYEAYSDGDLENGFSESIMDTAHGHLHFNYRLSSKSEVSFAQVLFHAHGLHNPLDLKKYRYINIEIDSTETDEFLLTLYLYIPYFSDPELTSTHRPYSIRYIENRWGESVHFPIKSLSTPLWWFRGNKIESIPPTDWRQLTHISISECLDSPRDTDLQITLSSLSFSDSIPIELGIAALFAGVYALIAIFARARYCKAKNKKIKQKIYYRENSDQLYNEGESEKVIQFIADHYGNPLLTLELIERKTGLNSCIVNEIIMNHCKMSYKKYVVYIRIHEAKRLLIETDRSIALIAEQVGYCYSNSFSRSFRTAVGTTPLQFRMQETSRLAELSEN